ncbi:hypothetical protein MMC20_004045 [Loxospora ochrophaea]|nr:hypothetical protein [Loxospora ochrophaea]
MPSTHPRKLRESCDACHLAKVKCTKTRTDCARCVSSGIPCCYSPSARTGKPRGAKDKRNRKESSESNGYSDSAPPQSTAESSSAPTVLQAPLSNAPYPQFSPGYDSIDPLFLDHWGNGISDALWQSFSEDRQFLPPGSMASSSNSPGNITFTPGDWADAVSTAAQTPMSTPSLSLLNTREMSVAPPFPTPSSTPIKQDDSGAKPLNAYSRATACDCFSTNLQSLQTLRRHSDNLSSQSATPFDVALSISKHAIIYGTAMLNCPHCLSSSSRASNSTPLLILASLIDDILALYGTACINHFDLAADSPSSVSETSSSSQLTLGTYLVDGEDGKHLKLEILMIELRKVERLWMQYREACGQVRAEGAQKSLLDSSVGYLAQTLRRTMSMLEARRSGVS